MIVRVEAQQRVFVGVHVQNFRGELLERQQKFRFVFEQELNVATRELHHHVGRLEIGKRVFPGLDDVVKFESRRLDYRAEKGVDSRSRLLNRILSAHRFTLSAIVLPSLSVWVLVA